MLREYQRKAIDDLYRWFGENEGNPCIVLPTGSGKSHVIAGFCKETIQGWPYTRILMLTHVKELIEQDAEKMLLHWPEAPLGIYSAGIGSREIDRITFAGIQSVRNRAQEIGHVDLILIDEAHLVSHRDEGSYRKLIGDLTEINPKLRVIGLTATPYRLGHGMITDEPALFTDLIEPTTIQELQDQGFLADLRSKATREKLITDGVHKRGGEYIESELQKAVDVHQTSESVVSEVISLAGDRKAWLFFCTGVDHAMHVQQILDDQGIRSACITGKTPKAERAEILERFKAGEIRAVTNANVLTTGFDYPDIDLIVMMRPTMSPGLYMQMAGRGLRLKSHTDHCLVLDFAGNVEMHGPITEVRPPKRKGESSGIAPSKVCEHCMEIVPIQAKICPGCGQPFPVEEKGPIWQLRNDDIMGRYGTDMEVDSWMWQPHISRSSGKPMIKVIYFGEYFTDPQITEYFPIHSGGRAEFLAIQKLLTIASQAKVGIRDCPDDLDLCATLNEGDPPRIVTYKKNGRFYQVMNRIWPQGRMTG